MWITNQLPSRAGGVENLGRQKSDDDPIRRCPLAPMGRILLLGSPRHAPRVGGDCLGRQIPNSTAGMTLLPFAVSKPRRPRAFTKLTAGVFPPLGVTRIQQDVTVPRGHPSNAATFHIQQINIRARFKKTFASAGEKVGMRDSKTREM